MSRLRGEPGVSLVEVIMGVFLLAIGLGFAVAAFPASGRQTHQAQRSEQAAAVAEREIEAMRRLSWASVGLRSMPNAAAAGLDPADSDQDNPRNPDFYVSSGKFLIKDDWHVSGSAPLAGTPAAGEDIIVTGSAGVDHISTTSIDGQNATIYRYVTGRNELCAAGLPTNLLNDLSSAVAGLLQSVLSIVNPILGTRINAFCAGPGPDAKRVVVAVVLDRVGNGTGPDRPVYLSTLMTDPNRGLLN